MPRANALMNGVGQRMMGSRAVAGELKTIKKTTAVDVKSRWSDRTLLLLLPMPVLREQRCVLMENPDLGGVDPAGAGRGLRIHPCSRQRVRRWWGAK